MSKSFSELAQVNPGVELPSGATASTDVSFVPMSDVSESGELTGRQVRKLGDVRNGFTSFADGDILVAKITPCFENGKGAHVQGLKNGVGFGSTEFHVLRARSDSNARYLHHIVQSARFRRMGEVFMTGSAGQKRVPREFFDAFEVPSLRMAEQQKIAQILDTLDTTIRQTEAIIAKLKQVKQGLLHDLLTRGIAANGELRPPQSEAPHLYKASALGWIPVEWNVVETAHRCSLITKGTTPASNQMWQGEEGVRFLRVDNLSFDGQLNFNASNFRISTVTHESELMRSQCLPGDVLTNIVGPPLGKLGLITEESGPININQAIALFRPTSDLLSNFLLTWLGSTLSQVWLRQRAKQTSGQVNLTLALCQELPIPDMTLIEQRAIVERVASSQARIDVEASTLHKLEQLKSGLMDDLLTGRVRVTPLLAQAPATQP
jgi:type I restriction enzyme S subunit